MHFNVIHFFSPLNNVNNFVSTSKLNSNNFKCIHIKIVLCKNIYLKINSCLAKKLILTNLSSH